MNQRVIRTRVMLTVIQYLIILITVIKCQDHYSISQISPKSLAYDDSNSPENIKSSIAFELIDDDDFRSRRSDSSFVRVERSALPILNEGKLSASENKVESSGRYYNSINPTGTSKDDNSDNEMTKNAEDNFLVKRGRSLRPQLKEVNTVMPMETATKVLTMPRQNNPDIQDIITGIVKLLNGNVNVHANNLGNRKPSNNRINNRGPPRISEAQVPIDNINQDLNMNNNNNKPQFERPENSLPIRPFLTGVPLPEQIVPSMQQNYRPGFVSQNRPPWKRPNPRPQNGFQRRPILQQQQHIHHQQQQQQQQQHPQTIPTHFEHEEEEDDDEVNEEEKEKPNNEQITNNHVSNSNNNNEHNDTDIEKHKIDSDKNDSSIASDSSTKNVTLKEAAEISPTNVVTTIIQSTSEVNTIQEIIDSASDEKIDTTTIVSSILESSIVNEISSTSITQTPILTSPVINVPSTEIKVESTSPIVNSNLNTYNHRPRPGMVLDDPEFKPGHKTNHQIPQRLPTQELPAGYGEIFDVTLSAIQGPSGNIGSQQTINIMPNYGSFDGTDIILSPSGDQGFVSIDGKRTYINLFGESSDVASQISNSQVVNNQQIKPTNVYQQQPLKPSNEITGTGYVVAETEPTIEKNYPLTPQNRHRPRPSQQQTPPQQSQVRIDTCIVGDDSTCDQTQNEKCKTENGVSSCNCKPGYARRKHREPCRKIVSLLVSIRVDKYHDRKIVWTPQLNDSSSEQYRTLKYESFRAIDSAMSMTPFSDEFMDAAINNIYQGDATKGLAGVFINFTLMIEENGETVRPTIRNEIQRHLIGVIHRRNNNIGNSALFVESPPGSVSTVQDLDECLSHDLNDCHMEASCKNIWGSYLCQCNTGFKDPNIDRVHRAGRECLTCSDSYCNNRGRCSYDINGNQVCSCMGSYYGSACEIDGEVLAVAVGASIAAIIIIILTLICLVMWSRKWQREHKNAMIGSPVFGYMQNAQVKTPVMGPLSYQVSLEDRMRWAQIADVMAQANHYAVEPVAANTRPSSAIFTGYHSTLNAGMTMQHSHNHNGTLPPVPLPRLGMPRPNMRNLENSSSSEEEDRIDLLGRNFQVPRPKSRSNASVTSAIYYDVDYLPSGDHHNLYGTSGNGTNGNQIQLSTYGAPSTYYK